MKKCTGKATSVSLINGVGSIIETSVTITAESLLTPRLIFTHTVRVKKQLLFLCSTNKFHLRKAAIAQVVSKTFGAKKFTGWRIHMRNFIHDPSPTRDLDSTQKRPEPSNPLPSVVFGAQLMELSTWVTEISRAKAFRLRFDRRCCELLAIDQAFPQIRRCGQRVVSRPARACSSGGEVRRQCVMRLESLL